MSERTDLMCRESEAVAALLRGKSAEDLRGAIHHMARCWRFSPGDLELALRHAAQCRHWRKADAAWARYEAVKARMADLPEQRDFAAWEARSELFKEQERAFSEYQRHDEAANKLWDRPPRAG